MTKENIFNFLKACSIPYTWGIDENKNLILSFSYDWDLKSINKFFGGEIVKNKLVIKL